MTDENTVFWNGQKKVNGKLCQVDWRLLEALKKVSAELTKLGADVADLNQLIGQTDQLSAEVALENPPGCFPTDRTGPIGG